jgi:hypothetical protein
MKRNRLIPLFLALMFISGASLVLSRDYGDSIAKEQDEFEKEFMDDSWEFYQEKQRDFQEFKDERDRDFAEFLKAQWEKVDFEKPMEIIEKPKPLKMPVAKLPPFPGKEVTRPPVPDEIPPEKIVKPEPVPEYVPPPEPVIRKPDPKAVEKGVPIEFSFYGTNIALRYDPQIKAKLTTPIDNKSISAFWADMARSDFEPLLRQVYEHRNNLQLNDWGYYVFLDKAGDKIIGPDENEKNLFVWFMLTKSGYETKVGYRKNKVFLFMPATTSLFGISFYTLEAKRYYAVSTSYSGGRLGSVQTYKGKYPGADRSMDFLLRKYPHIPGNMSTKELSFYDAGKKHSIKVAINDNNIPFFKYHPQTDVGLYAMAALPAWMGTTLLDGLRPFVEGKSEKEAINLLLRFTQTAFAYKTDQMQFGREKVMFPEEMVFYPFSDCEDRSIFFSYLVRNLMGHDVILLSYPNHIATAVLLKGQPEGDYVLVNGKAYTVCDPTYINAVLGMAMPQFKGVTPKVIVI